MAAIITHEYINQNYNKLKNWLMWDWHQMSIEPFDEDIFHDTLLKCIEKFENKDMENDSEFVSYLRSAFKTNALREKLYFRNLQSADVPLENIYRPTTPNYNIDMKLVLEKVEKEFGKIACEQFQEWVEGSSIKELNEKYNCSNMRYVMDKIRQFVKMELTDNV